MIRFLFLISLITISNNILAQDSINLNDSVKTAGKIEEKSPIKSLSISEYNAYKNGVDKGYSRSAEMNNYPGPENVMKYQKELKLSPVQISQLKKVISDKKFKVLEMGGFILAKEKLMNDLFASGKADDGSIIYYTNQLGLYDAELRNAYLQANLKTKRILSPDQIKKYYKLKSISK